MPVSTPINTKKTKSRSEELCERMDAMIATAQAQVKIYANIREDLEVEPGLLKKALSMKLGSEEDMKQVVAEMNSWKAEVKHDLKAALTEKKNELKLARKERRKNLQEGMPDVAKTPRRKKKSRGGFV